MQSGDRGFWSRQFDDSPTLAQTVFDVLFGIILPVACLVFDPIIFKSEIGSGGGMGLRYAIGAYVCIGLQVLVLSLWLLIGTRLESGAAWFSGPLLAGGLIAVGLAILIFPLTLIGTIVFGIGLLGLIPFFTGFTFWRNGIRAIRRTERQGRVRQGR